MVISKLLDGVPQLPITIEGLRDSTSLENRVECAARGQPSAISYQLSAISHQLSAISYQLSAISYDGFVVRLVLRRETPAHVPSL